MSRVSRWAQACLAVVICLVTILGTGLTAEAAGKGNALSGLNAGVAQVLYPTSASASDVIKATAEELHITFEAKEEEPVSDLVMANVKNALNLREEPDNDAKKIGKVYKDCGGTILEEGDGWTKIQSGNAIGWANNDYLLFGEDALELAQEVGITLATVNTTTLRVRSEANTEASVLGLLPQGEIMEVVDDSDENWVVIDYEGQDGYVSREFLDITFQIDTGETMEEIEEREAAEAEAKRHVNYGEFTADADETMLLAALIQCEAGGESYEGQVAVGAVVMNRVRSSAYPDTIHGVIYASGQFTPAMNGKVNRVYESGKVKQSCIDAAEEALSGVSNVGDRTHFRRNNGRDGLVIGNHVFY